MVLPDKVTDVPVQGLKQFDGERTDRLNDLTQQQAKEKQQELRELEANNEVKDEEKHADVGIAEDIQNMQKTEADKKRKQAQDQAQAIGTRTCSKTRQKANSTWKSSKTTPKYDSDDCGHRSRRRRPTSRTTILRRK